jgi:hypothetical protein
MRWAFVVKQKHSFEAVLEGGKMGEAIVYIPLIHTIAPETSALDVEKKKAELKTPHFLSLSQDVVAWSQEAKCEVCNPHYELIIKQ